MKKRIVCIVSALTLVMICALPFSAFASPSPGGKEVTGSTTLSSGISVQVKANFPADSGITGLTVTEASQKASNTPSDADVLTNIAVESQPSGLLGKVTDCTVTVTFSNISSEYNGSNVIAYIEHPEAVQQQSSSNALAANKIQANYNPAQNAANKQQVAASTSSTSSTVSNGTVTISSKTAKLYTIAAGGSGSSSADKGSVSPKTGQDFSGFYAAAGLAIIAIAGAVFMIRRKSNK